MSETHSKRKRRTFHWPPAARQLVREYQEHSDLSCERAEKKRGILVTRLVKLSGNPRQACLRFLCQLGVTEKRCYRVWTTPEQQRLFDLIETCPVEEVSRIMQRSPRSIRSMLHRLGESSQRGRDWFTVYSLAEALHVRSAGVQRWIDQGWLKCRVVETNGVKKRIIDPEDFSEFVKQYGRAVVGRRLNSDGLSFVQNFVFPPKHAHLLPLRKSKNMSVRDVEEEDEADKSIGQSA